MSKSMGLEKLKFYPVDLVKKMASYHIRIFKERVKGGKDKDDSPFRPYSRKYAEQKQRGMTGLSGKKYERYRGIPINTQTSPPNYTLRGKGMTLSAMRFIDIDSDSYKLNWTGEPALIVQGNKERGRNILGVPKSEINKIVKILGKETEKQFRKKLKDITVRVG